jgi:hypothetical protein
VLSRCASTATASAPRSRSFARSPAAALGIIAIDASERNGDVVDLDLVVENDSASW